MKNVGIIGSGLAGIAAAKRLLQIKGIQVTIFDKSRGTGGRLSTRRGDNWECDHGAQYYAARNPTFQTELNEWVRSGTLKRWESNLMSYDGNWNKMDSTLHYVGVPQMKSPLVHLLNSLEVKTELHTTISEMKQESDRSWRLHSKEHGWCANTFDTILTAVPAPQALPLLEQHSVQLSQVSRASTMKPSWAVMLHFKKPIAACIDIDGAVIKFGALGWICKNTSKPQRSSNNGETWLLHASSEWSEANLEISKEEAAATLTEEFKHLVGTISGRGEEVNPVETIAHRWRFANLNPASVNSAIDGSSIFDTSKMLGVCGDWTYENGGVEGAYLSGVRVAEQALEALS